MSEIGPVLDIGGGVILAQSLQPAAAGRPIFFKNRFFGFFCGGFGKIAKARPLRGWLRNRSAISQGLGTEFYFGDFVWFLKTRCLIVGVNFVAAGDRVRGFLAWTNRFFSCVQGAGTLVTDAGSVASTGLCFGTAVSDTGSAVSDTAFYV